MNHFFMNLPVIVTQQTWQEFVIEFPALFNELFKHCVKSVASKLKIAYCNSGANLPNNTNSSCSLSRDFEYLHNSMHFSDLELEVEGKIMKAHKSILMSNFKLYKFCPFNGSFFLVRSFNSLPGDVLTRNNG